MAQTVYCNTTTDLLRAYPRIMEAFREKRVISGYSQYSSTVFKIGGLGYVEAMFEDGVAMTAAATLNATDAAKEFFYDATTDILYWYPTGGVPDDHTYEVGENWATVLTDVTEMASRDAEAVLDTKYEVPLPMSPDGTTARPYDRDFINAVALLACSHIAGRAQPPMFDANGNAVADNLAGQLQVAGEKILKDYISGARVFSWEITADEIGGHNIRATSTNTSAGIIQLRGKYDPSVSRATSSVFSDAVADTYVMTDPYWKVKIIVGGVLGTATFNVSLDNGTTYSGTVTATSNQWIHIYAGVWVRFLTYTAASVYVADDTWQLEIYNPERTVTSSRIKSVPIRIV